jgi:hypothetical protein
MIRWFVYLGPLYAGFFIGMDVARGHSSFWDLIFFVFTVFFSAWYWKCTHGSEYRMRLKLLTAMKQINNDRVWLHREDRVVLICWKKFGCVRMMRVPEEAGLELDRADINTPVAVTYETFTVTDDAMMSHFQIGGHLAYTDEADELQESKLDKIAFQETRFILRTARMHFRGILRIDPDTVDTLVREIQEAELVERRDNG